jgi:hypothetical protein
MRKGDVRERAAQPHVAPLCGGVRRIGQSAARNLATPPVAIIFVRCARQLPALLRLGSQRLKQNGIHGARLRAQTSILALTYVSHPAAATQWRSSIAATRAFT